MPAEDSSFKKKVNQPKVVNPPSGELNPPSGTKKQITISSSAPTSPNTKYLSDKYFPPLIGLSKLPSSKRSPSLEGTGKMRGGLLPFKIQFIDPSYESSPSVVAARKLLKDNFHTLTARQLKLLIFNAPWIDDLLKTDILQNRLNALLAQDPDIVTEQWNTIVIKIATKEGEKYVLIPGKVNAIDDTSNPPKQANSLSFLLFIFTHGRTYISPDSIK